MILNRNTHRAGVTYLIANTGGTTYMIKKIKNKKKQKNKKTKKQINQIKQ